MHLTQVLYRWESITYYYYNILLLSIVLIQLTWLINSCFIIIFLLNIFVFYFVNALSQILIYLPGLIIFREFQQFFFVFKFWFKIFVLYIKTKTLFWSWKYQLIPWILYIHFSWVASPITRVVCNSSRYAQYKWI